MIEGFQAAVIFDRKNRSTLSREGQELIAPPGIGSVEGKQGLALGALAFSSRSVAPRIPEEGGACVVRDDEEADGFACQSEQFWIEGGDRSYVAKTIVHDRSGVSGRLLTILKRRWIKV